ncbi:MAG: hypothetical protein IPO17_16575 [Flavobacteriales bacterium]|nr:hypothetical protein [Flavobacteriales bacterium]
MRNAAVGCCLLVVGVCTAQPSTLPLSRAVEAPWAAQAHSLHSGMHTAIRPYLIRDLRALPGGDTLQGTAAMDLLERWGRNAFDSTTTGLRWRGGPLLDASVGVDAGSASALTWRGGAGAWMEADAGKRWSFHLDGQAWNENWSDYLDTLVDAQQVSLGEGYAYGDDEARSHYDWNGWASFVPDDAFVLTVGRGKHFFGEGHRSFFLSDNAGSYPFLRINTEFWKIKYVNLFTVMDDIRGAGGTPSSYDRKFSSFHYLSWNVTRRLNVAVFEGVVWQGADEKFPRGFDINYLNPVIFYRPVEYSQGSGDNALLGLALNVKPGKKSLFYSQVMLDEFLLDAVRAGDGWYGNKQAFQLGLVAYEAFKLKTLMLRAEFNYARPFIYTHSDTRQNYAHAGQPLAHPYGSNFREMLVRAEWRKKRWMVSAHLSYATLGQDTGAYSWGSNIFRPESDRYSTDGVRPDNYGYFLADPVEVNILFAEIIAAWTIDPRSGLRAEAAYVLRSRQPHGAANETTNWFRIGISANLRQRYHDQEVRYVLE